MNRARLVLEDGTELHGRLQGFPVSVAGEVVFNTGMVGYTESLTDPSYRGQILCLTYPLVGNYGVPPHFESGRIQAAALVVSELAEEYSHALAQKSLPQWLHEQGIPCLTGVDTRALTKRLRLRGCMLGKLVAGEQDVPLEDPNKRNLVADTSIGSRQVYPGGKRTVLLVDTGAKSSIIDELLRRDLTVLRVPWDHDFLEEDFDALFLSNGPGDPGACAATIRNVARAMQANRPIMGICLGHQLLALAAGASTYKLTFGHRGHNQPCREEGSGRCFITSQNHGFAVRGDGPAVTHVSLYDGTVEGIALPDEHARSLQFHPEAAPGPVDCAPLFAQFVSMIP